MDSALDDEDLPRLLQALEADPEDADTRLRACVAANRRAMNERDPAWADVAETLAAEGLPARNFGRALQEQLHLARAARRSICASRPAETTIDAAGVAPAGVVA